MSVQQNRPKIMRQHLTNSTHHFKKSYVLGIFLLFLCLSGMAQQENLYYTYPENGLSINPAYAGSNGLANLLVMVRRQSLTLPQSGSAQYLSYNTPLRMGKSFLGFQAFNSGFSGRSITGTGFNLSSGYRHHFTDSISVALAASFNFTQVPGFLTGNQVFKPSAGVGLYFRTYHSYFGIAAPTITQVRYQTSKDNYISFPKPIWASIGHVLHPAEHWALKLGAIYKTIDNVADFNAVAWYRERFGVGFWYSNLGSEVNFEKATVLTADVQINKKFRLGLSYDFSATKRNDNLSSGQTFKSVLSMYQFTLRYDFDNQTGKIDRFRFF